MACVDAKTVQCSVTPGEPVSKVIDGNNTSSRSVQMTPLDNDDLLQEILLHLPPKPSSLPRSSLVCTRWRNILSDTDFLKRFRKHHRKPPLLGFFKGITGSHFVSVLDMKPDRIPAARFAVPKSIIDCRHRLAVLIRHLVSMEQLGREVFVWDPLTGHQRCLSFPPGLRHAERYNFSVWHAAVWCADGEDGHVHGDCFLSPFKVVLICSIHKKTFACLYDSRSGVWGNIASMETTDKVLLMRSSVLIGSAVYWLFYGGDILAFDTDRQTLDVIEKPRGAHHTSCLSFQLWRTYDDSCLGLAVMSKLGIQLWKRNSKCDNVNWVLLQKIIQLESLFPRGMRSDLKKVAMVGYEEDSNIIVLATHIGDFMLELESMQFSSISKRNFWCDKIHIPYRNFYTSVTPRKGEEDLGSKRANQATVLCVAENPS